MCSFQSCVIFPSVICTILPYPFICRWTSRLLPCPSYCKQYCNEHWGACVYYNSDFQKANLFARILLRIFASVFISDTGLQFSFFVFFVTSLSGFGIRVMVALWNDFGSLPSSLVFWKSLSRFSVSSSLNFWQYSPVKPSGTEHLFVRRYLVMVLISMLVNYLFRFSVSSWFDFGRLYFYKNLPISSKLSILLTYGCSQQSLMTFCISVLSVVISSCSFLILLI